MNGVYCEETCSPREVFTCDEEIGKNLINWSSSE